MPSVPGKLTIKENIRLEKPQGSQVQGCIEGCQRQQDCELGRRGGGGGVDDG